MSTVLGGWDLPREQREGLDLKSLSSTSRHNAVNTLLQYFHHAQNQHDRQGGGFGQMRPYLVYDDLPDITKYTDVLYLGMLKDELHWINTDKGLPAVLTDKIFIETQYRRFENINPVLTPALGVSRMGRSSVTSMISKLENYTQSFMLEGEYATVKGAASIAMNLQVCAGNTARFMAFMAYQTILLNAALYAHEESRYDEQLLMMRLEKERDEFAIVHKQSLGMVRLIDRYSKLMETGPARVRPTVCIVPPCKYSVISNSPQFRDFRLAGEKGPQLLRNGTLFDDHTGSLRDGTTHEPVSLLGVEICEAPYIQMNDNSIENISMPIYTGEFMHCTTRQNSYFGEPEFEGHEPLPYWRIFDIEEDDWSDVKFEHMFLNCGRFRRVQVSEDEVNDGLNPDLHKHLWVVDTNPFEGDDVNLENLLSGDNDPFLEWKQDPHDGRAKPMSRPWCTPPLRHYTADLPNQPELIHVSLDWRLKVMSLPEDSPERRQLQAIDAENQAKQAKAETYWKTIAPSRCNAPDQSSPADGHTSGSSSQSPSAASRHASGPSQSPSAVGGHASGSSSQSSSAAGRQTRSEVPAGKQTGRNAPADEQTGSKAPAFLVQGWTMAEWKKRLDFLALRPMVGTNMQTISFIAGGSDLGNTYYGSTGYSMGFDAGNRSYEFRLDARMGPHISNKYRVANARHVVYDGVLTGGNARVMTVEQARQVARDDFVLEDGSPSIYSICIPKPHILWKDEDHYHSAFDGTKSIISIKGHTPFGSSLQSRPHYPGAQFYSSLYGFDRLDMQYPQQGGTCYPIAMMCFKGGIQFPTRNGYETVQSQGHHGPEAPGTRNVRMYGFTQNPILDAR